MTKCEQLSLPVARLMTYNPPFESQTTVYLCWIGKMSNSRASMKRVKIESAVEVCQSSLLPSTVKGSPISGLKTNKPNCKRSINLRCLEARGQYVDIV